MTLLLRAIVWPEPGATGWRRSATRHPRRGLWLDVASAVAGAMALAGFAHALMAAAPVDSATPETAAIDQRAEAIARRAAIAERVRYQGGEKLTAFYGGSPYTYASDVRIEKPGTDLTVHGVDWEGKPFDHPIYYGVRHARWLPASNLGWMVDFTHSKVYAPMEQEATYSGTRDGAPVAKSGKVGDQFHKLEFTHGHNMLTFNGLLRLPFQTGFLSPYVGAGFGVSLPHTEVQLKGDNARTYDYQYTGPAMQTLFGIEFRLPKVSYFLEYKLTYAHYRAPLYNHDGAWVISDLKYQLQRWLGGNQPEGGWATTQLLSHQVIGGLGYRTAPAPLAKP